METFNSVKEYLTVRNWVEQPDTDPNFKWKLGKEGVCWDELAAFTVQLAMDKDKGIKLIEFKLKD